MASTELTLLMLKYGVPLAVKLLHDGFNETQAVEMATVAVENLDGGLPGIAEILLKADKEKTKNIIDDLFALIKDTGNAFVNLIGTLLGLFGGAR